MHAHTYAHTHTNTEVYVHKDTVATLECAHTLCNLPRGPQGHRKQVNTNGELTETGGELKLPTLLPSFHPSQSNITFSRQMCKGNEKKKDTKLIEKAFMFIKYCNLMFLALCFSNPGNTLFWKEALKTRQSAHPLSGHYLQHGLFLWP